MWNDEDNLVFKQQGTGAESYGLNMGLVESSRPRSFYKLKLYNTKFL